MSVDLYHEKQPFRVRTGMALLAWIRTAPVQRPSLSSLAARNATFLLAWICIAFVRWRGCGPCGGRLRNLEDSRPDDADALALSGVFVIFPTMSVKNRLGAFFDNSMPFREIRCQMLDVTVVGDRCFFAHIWPSFW